MPWYFIKTSLLFLLWVGQEAVSAQHLSWRNFTVDQGLPGNIVYDMLEDRQGYLWFVTDQGICRFNGYEFIQPVDTSAMRGSEAFVPAEDSTGKIWFARLDGSVWFIENDTVRAWKYNKVTEPYRGKSRQIQQLGVGKDSSGWLALAGFGFLTVSKDGIPKAIKGSPREGFMFAEVGGKLIYTPFATAEYLRETKPSAIRPFEIWHWKEERAIWQGKIQISLLEVPSKTGVWKLRNGDFVFYCENAFYLIRNNRIVWQAPAKLFAEELLELPDGGILVASHQGNNVGLFHFASIEHLQRGESRNLLPGLFVTNVGFDREGGWWAATHHAGVYYCKNPALEIFDQQGGLPSSDVVCLANDGATTIFAGMRPVGVAAINYKNGKRHILPDPPLSSREVQAICFEPFSGRLWCGDRLFYLGKNQWEPVIRYDSFSQRSETVPIKTIMPDPSGKAIWVSSPYGFHQIDARNGTAVYLGKTEDTDFVARTFSVTPDRYGNIWVTTAMGLRLWRNGAYELPPFDHPALRFQPRGVIIMPDGGMAISLRGAGVLIRDVNNVLIHLTRQDGLTSDFITKLYSSPEGVLFACSNAGLNRLTPQAAGSWIIETISVKEGLPSNQINDVTTLAGETWVATAQGLARFRDLPAPFLMPAPVLEKLLVNNQNAVFDPGLRLAHHENNLSIRFFALHYRSGGDIPYRYRLLGADTAVVYSTTREVNFVNLSPGAYTFEVQAQNEARQWSAPTRWVFEIHAAWWQTGWFWMSITLISAIGFGLWYRDRLRKARQEVEVRNKIRDLEAAALRAQMNPHFIFNCLGSIQHFISENDAASATRYLSRFARLVRLALHGSVDGRHSLQEEVEMLENYLVLEQLRFRGKFTYEIEVSPELDPEDVFVPPMLVQPFVENALLHGMKNKQEGGRISVAFSQKENLLLATVSDNGPGFTSDDKNLSETGHKSVGMTLTQRRLDILAEQPGQEALHRENILAADGTIQGMRVVLQVPLG
ncbi:MAG: histidine kinase [Saprospiraceae bacterium]